MTDPLIDILTQDSMITCNFYQTPVVEYLETESEGVLCQSDAGKTGIKDWVQGEGSIDF